MRHITFAFLLIFSCKNVEKKAAYISLSVEKFGSEDVECLSNKEENLVLCISNKYDITRPKQLRFFVYSKEEGAIVYERDIDQGAVAWESNHELRLVLRPGMMRANETVQDYMFIIDVLTGTERKVSRN